MQKKKREREQETGTNRSNLKKKHTLASFHLNKMFIFLCSHELITEANVLNECLIYIN